MAVIGINGLMILLILKRMAANLLALMEVPVHIFMRRLMEDGLGLTPIATTGTRMKIKIKPSMANVNFQPH
jgi:hypothetical protein